MYGSPSESKAGSSPRRPYDLNVLVVAANGGATGLKFSKGQNLFRQGEPAESVFYIQEGRVKITVVSPQGKEAVIAMLEARQFCGEACLAGHDLRTASAIAMTDCIASRMDRAAVTRMIHDNREFAELFTDHLLARTIRVEADLVDQLFNSSEKRLARLLLILANLDTGGQTGTITPHISQEVLAEMIGTTRSRVSFFMNKFRQLGFIDYKGDLEVHVSLAEVLQAESGANPPGKYG
jgi:CRP-like cAMP-binding protein